MTLVRQVYRVGGFNVCCYHNCTHAAAIHTELKRRHIDAAVVDHAFVMSPLQLAVALFRVESSCDTFLQPNKSRDGSGLLQQQQQQSPPPEESTPSANSAYGLAANNATAPQSVSLPGRKLPFSRRIFASLSLTHNLDRILQILPPGPQTSSVVILYHSPCAPPVTPHLSPLQANPVERHGTHLNTTCLCDSNNAVQLEQSIEAAIAQTVRSTNPTAVAHSFHGIREPFWQSDAVHFADEAKLMEYYNISETMMLAAQHSLTRRDMKRICDAAEDASETAQKRALRWHTLELCITTQLAASTA
jgi:hypothetical protein